MSLYSCFFCDCKVDGSLKITAKAWGAVEASICKECFDIYISGDDSKLRDICKKKFNSKITSNRGDRLKP